MRELSGLKSLNRALDSGYTLNQIRDQTAREGVTFGYRAQDFLNARPSKPIYFLSTVVMNKA